MLLLDALILSSDFLPQWQKFSSSSVEVGGTNNLSLGFASNFFFFFPSITPFYNNGQVRGST